MRHHNPLGFTFLEWVKLLAISIAIALVVTVFIMGAAAYIHTIEKCTDNGGSWVKYNCRDISSMSCSYDTKGQLEECHTETTEHCDEKCVGAKAEEQ